MDMRQRGFRSIEVDGLDYRTASSSTVVQCASGRRGRRSRTAPSSGTLHCRLTSSFHGGGRRMIVGTGVHGSLPVMPEVTEEAGRRGVDLDAIPTDEACRLIAGLDARNV